MSYPRDLVGYGQVRPIPNGPDGARLALQIVVNYEEGGESSDPPRRRGESEVYLQEVVGTTPVVGQRNLSVESVYEYGSAPVSGG